MGKIKLFQSLSNEEKIQFFSQCQDILIKYHPNSEFLVTKENWLDKKHFALEFINKYKGYTYYNDRICILFNKVRIEDSRNPIKSLRDHLFKPSVDNYNAYCIDFVAFNKLAHCLEFVKQEYIPQIEYILFVKNNEVKLYKTDKLVEKLNSPLVHLMANF